jgi:hypothetical protein
MPNQRWINPKYPTRHQGPQECLRRAKQFVFLFMHDDMLRPRDRWGRSETYLCLTRLASPDSFPAS